MNHSKQKLKQLNVSSTLNLMETGLIVWGL